MTSLKSHLNNSLDNVNDLAESIRAKLIVNSIVEDKDVVVLDQKLIIYNLQGYKGEYFLNLNNNCIMRCFAKTPNLIAIICEYTLDTEINEIENVVSYLRDSLSDLGFTLIDI